MASTTSPETSEIRRRGRRRLIGAIAIAVMLVVFVPMILDSEPRPTRNAPALEIPSKENAPPLPPPAPKAPAAAPQAEPAKTSEAAPKASTPAAKTQPAAPKGAPAAAKPAAPKLEGFAVQVGAFKEDEKLKQARDKLAAAGVAHYIERIGAGSGTLTRLRAGPFPTREAAEKALAQLRSASLDGQVVALP